MVSIQKVLSRFRKQLRIARASEIAERYFIMNSFDGALATLGVILGAYIAGIIDPHIILSAGFGASFAMGISGAWGAFVTERAQRAKSIKELEQAMFTELKDSIIVRASRAATIWVAFVDALSPIIAAFVTLSPFLLSLYSLISSGEAFVASIVLNMTTLFILGLFLGRISRSSMIKQGLLMVLAGVITLLFLFALGLTL
ncbi:MAG: VIT1/CCC1 transporter family protein [Nitrososphaerales archaeon]